MSRRTGSWRVVQVLATALTGLWVGGFILVWLAFFPTSTVRIYVPLGIPIIVAELIYLNLYELPKKKRPAQL